jgi:hypothetical protein
MSVGFGFSIGGFIATLQLVTTVIDALQDSGKSSSANRELMSELRTLDFALRQVSHVELDSSQTAHQIALQQAAAQCQRTILGFWNKIKVYQPHLSSSGSTSRIKDGWMKIRWALCNQEDVANFRADLVTHTGSIQLLLITLQMERDSLHTREQEQRQKSLASKIQDLSSQWLGSLSSLISGLTTSIELGRQLQVTAAHILRTNLEVFKIVLRMQQVITQILGQIGQQQQPVYFWDAKGFYAPFYLEFINSSEVGLLFDRTIEILY